MYAGKFLRAGRIIGLRSGNGAGSGWVLESVEDVLLARVGSSEYGKNASVRLDLLIVFSVNPFFVFDGYKWQSR